MKNIRQEIESRLKKIEQEEEVSILYACESGSRAWGFPSADSDFFSFPRQRLANIVIIER